MSQSALPTRRIFATIKRAASECGVHHTTVRQRINKGDLPVFKLPGKSEHFVDLNEAKALFGKRQQYGSFGPDAKVIDLSNVVDADFTVVES